VIIHASVIIHVHLAAFAATSLREAHFCQAGRCSDFMTICVLAEMRV